MAESRTCPDCEIEIGITEEFCPKCGFDLSLFDESTLEKLNRAANVLEKRKKKKAEEESKKNPTKEPSPKPQPQKKTFFDSLRFKK